MDSRSSFSSGRSSPPTLINNGTGINAHTHHPRSPPSGSFKNEKFGGGYAPVMGRPSHDPRTYLSGPLDPMKHSKLPYFMRLHGSIMPTMILPMLFVFVWATTITVISQYGYPLSMDSVLLTVLGFVVGLSLSFRSSTAYERYIEGRKFWQQLILHSRNLARVIWIHPKERDGPLDKKEDVLAKLTAINLIAAFAQSVKHKLRYEIEYDYKDLQYLIDHLDTFAKSAHSAGADSDSETHNKLLHKIKTWGESLGVPFFQTNPAKPVKQAASEGRHHGNLPFEIMTYISVYIEDIMRKGQITAPYYTQIAASQLAMMDAYGGCERVLQTPLPLAYSIAISQITWLYVLVLPFQLFEKLGWVTIPGTIIAAYIILGLAAIGLQIENPFGSDVNDLPLDRYCTGLEVDLNVLTSHAPPGPEDWMMKEDNKPLARYSDDGWDKLKAKSLEEIREELVHKMEHHMVEAVKHPDSSERTEKPNGAV